MMGCALVVALYLLTLGWASEIVGVFIANEALVGSPLAVDLMVMP